MRVVIADDKAFEREKLKRILDWRRFGVEIVGEAENGRDALELCLRYRPEVLITDIRMPVMNGIELTKALEDNLADIHVIYLSSYNDFSYAQQAIALNVRRYLLKPFSEQDIIDVLVETLGEINEKQRRRQQQENQALLIQGNLPLLRQAFFKDLMNHPFDPRTFWDKAEVLGLKFSNDSFMMLGVEVSRSVNRVFRHRTKPADALQTVVTECVPPHISDIQVIEDDRQCFVLMSIQDQYVAEAKSRIELFKIDICTLMETRGHTVRLRASGIGYGPASWPRLFWETAFPNAGDCGGASMDAERVYEEYRHIEPEIINSLTGLQKDYSSHLLDDVFGRFPEGMKAVYLTKICISFACALQRLQKERQLTGLQSDDSFFRCMEEILALSEINDVLVWMKKMLSMAEREIKPYRKKRNAQIIEQVLEIIQRSYGDGIDVADISSRVFISQNYLRGLFKEQTGQSLSAYLCEYRIEKACELLRCAKYKITDIPGMVGLANSPYFFFLFKKATGLTPGEYRIRYAADDL